MNENKRKDRQRNTPLDFSLGYLQPQAPEIEKAVLGALMIDKEAYLLICETLRPESFYETRHQKIFDAVRQLSMKEEPVDVLTVTEQLAKMGDLEQIGGPGYIAELGSRVATSANIEYHANIIAQKYLSRQLISYTSTIGTKAFDETYDVNDVIQEAESILFDIAQTNMKKDYVHINPLIKEAEKILMTASSNNGDVTGISTGYYKLDDITSG
jgi:replicative DNA helicase